MKNKILIILQNAYMYRSTKFRSPVYDVNWINRKNATYSRIVPSLEPHFELFFTECTSAIADNKNKKFQTDLEWVKKALAHDDF